MKEGNWYMEMILIVHVSALNVQEMFGVPKITAFCMLWKTTLLSSNSP